tara:strand:+ start:321 stop:1313 length:993 start_codon:yes stop_codon:yes gene_type:complete
MNHQLIIKNIARGSYSPIYFLHGQEPYYIDLIEKFATSQIIKNEAKDFDQTIVYAKDTDLQTIINSAKRFPMMGSYQVISVREAQNFKNFDKLIDYAKKPQDQTILIFSFKGKKLDARTQKKLNENVDFFESKKLYDNQIPGWITKQVESQQLKISEKSSVILSDFLGNNLAKIANEIKKLSISIPKDSEITPEIIEKNIGISKDYNIFELSNAIANKEIIKANRIVNHFASNEKNYPLVVTLSSFYRLFSKIMGCYFSPSDQPDIVAKTIGVNPFFAKDYINGKRNYSKRQIFKIIGYLNDYDLKSKGYGNVSTSDGELLKELVFKILH